MGGKQTKMESDFSTPAKQNSEDINLIDPRSPNFCRTPLEIVPESAGGNGRIDILRKRFLKGFTYSINDPRSPSLNRTPLILEDSNERSLNLDDTFADLFVGPSVVPNYQTAKTNDCDNIDMEVTDNQTTEQLPQTPVAIQQKIDPRSPSIGVERTPIIFSDDENETNEDVALENILSTLTLNMNESNCSVVSLKTVEVSTLEETCEGVLKPTNKQLDRVKLGNRGIKKGQQKRQKQKLRQKIYEDCENQPSTPKLKVSNANANVLKNGRRTPLSCVRNSSQLRSRSVDSSSKSNKNIMAIMSYDDAIIPNEHFKMSNVM
ncbi:msb1l [Musca autumnalis]|uniref:msb1l n=1 Tax=Musca autumnalis TaxID=221902 RepID=UPI003CF33880